MFHPTPTPFPQPVSVAMREAEVLLAERAEPREAAGAKVLAVLAVHLAAGFCLRFCYFLRFSKVFLWIF